MKKLGLVLCAVLLVFGSFQLAVAAPYNKATVEWCKYIVDNYDAYDSVGDCVSDYNSATWLVNWCKMAVDSGWYDSVGECVGGYQSNGWAPAYCKAPSYFDPSIEMWEVYGFKNRGDCVSYFRDWKW